MTDDDDIADENKPEDDSPGGNEDSVEAKITRQMEGMPPWGIILMVLAGAVVLEWLVPWSLPTIAWWDELGFITIVVALIIIGGSAWQIKKARDESEDGAHTLLSDGFFQYSRNPIYMGILLAFVGAGLAENSTWLVLASVAAFMSISRFVIEREEAALEDEFGADYIAYKDSTRRWL